jgi:hypothetical protein
MAKGSVLRLRRCDLWQFGRWPGRHEATRERAWRETATDQWKSGYTRGDRHPSQVLSSSGRARHGVNFLSRSVPTVFAVLPATETSANVAPSPTRIWRSWVSVGGSTFDPHDRPLQTTSRLVPTKRALQAGSIYRPSPDIYNLARVMKHVPGLSFSFWPVQCVCTSAATIKDPPPDISVVPDTSASVPYGRVLM